MNNILKLSIEMPNFIVILDYFTKVWQQELEESEGEVSNDGSFLHENRIITLNELDTESDMEDDFDFNQKRDSTIRASKYEDFVKELEPTKIMN